MMKRSFVVLGALAGAVSASCCSHNNCLRAIIGHAFPERHGEEDCSSYLAVTVTPATSTFTATASTVLTVSTAIIESDTITITETVTASTETDVAHVTDTVTDATETIVVDVTETLTVATETDVSHVTVTEASGAGAGNTFTAVPRAPVTSSSPSSQDYPSYASACSSFAGYASACGCVGVKPTTVTADAPSTTITVTATQTAIVSVSSTVIGTETDVESVTVTAVVTQSDDVSVTAEVTVTTTEIDSATATAFVTLTSTYKPTSATPSCLATPTFKAMATQYQNQPLYMYDNSPSPLEGNIFWEPNGASDEFTEFSIDASGHLYLTNKVGGFPYLRYAYVFLAGGSDGRSEFPGLEIQSAVESLVAAGEAAYLDACVDSVSHELTISANSLDQILWCGQELWMSNQGGSDINRGTCTQMFPVASLV